MSRKLRIHEIAARGFDLAADAYETGRPDYPDEVALHFVKVFRLSHNSKVLDLGAGTGKFTRVLQRILKSSVLALEPVPAMRRMLAQMVPGADVVAGMAERIPFRNSSFDAVVIAQAFHWFSSSESLKEIHRVLRTGGGLGLVWNVRDSSLSWVKELNKVIDRYVRRKKIPRYKGGSWRDQFSNSNLFSRLLEKKFDFVQKGTQETMLDRFLSISYIASLEEKQREAFASEIRKILARVSVTSQENHLIELPYHADVYWCFKEIASR
jgi:ubiquinone/menaquinone biosynthesis C-methylase UbiE